MNISEAVKSALGTAAITQSQALIISQLVIEKEEKDGNKVKRPNEIKQDEFLRILLSKQGGRDQPKFFGIQNQGVTLASPRQIFMQSVLFTIS